MSKPRYPFVIVSWRDSHGISPGWINRQEVAERPIGVCWSSGWVLVDDDDRLVLAPHLAPQVDDVAGDITIPAEAIVERYEVEL